MYNNLNMIKKYIVKLLTGLIIFTISGVAFGLNDDIGDTRSTASLLPLDIQSYNQDMAGIVSSKVDGNNDQDFFKFTSSKKGRLFVYTTGDIDTYGQLLNSSGNVVVQDDDMSRSQRRQIGRFHNISNLNRANFYIAGATLNANSTYYINVKGKSSNVAGDYRMHAYYVYDEDDHPNNRLMATLLSLPSTGNPGNISYKMDQDVFKIEVPEAGILTLSSAGSFDTFGTLHGSDIYTFDNNSGSGNNFSISKSVNAGTYHLTVRHVNTTSWNTETGSYTVNVNFEEGEVGDYYYTSLDVGSPNINMLGKINEAYDDDFYKIWWNGGKLTIYTTGETDTMATLYSGNITQLAFNDDWGSSRNSYIQKDLSAGYYYIKIEGWNSTTGPFLLHICGNSSGTC